MGKARRAGNTPQRADRHLWKSPTSVNRINPGSGSKESSFPHISLCTFKLPAFIHLPHLILPKMKNQPQIASFFTRKKRIFFGEHTQHEIMCSKPLKILLPAYLKAFRNGSELSFPLIHSSPSQELLLVAEPFPASHF